MRVLIARFVRRTALAVLTTALAGAADGPVKFTAAPSTVELRPGATATVRLHLQIAPPYHVYSPLMRPDPRGGGPSATTISVQPAGLFAIDGAVRVSPGKKQFDPNFQMDVLTLEDRAWIDIAFKGAATLAAGVHDATLTVSYQACTEESCLPPVEVEIAFKVSVGATPSAASTDDPRWREAEQLAATLNARESEPGERDRRMQRYAALAWTLYTAHPDDPRRWQAFETIARGTLRFITGFKPGYTENPSADKLIIDEAALREWMARAAQVEVAAMRAADSPESFRELIAGKKVSALVLPYTNTVLPPDWSVRLVPPIEELAAKYPNGTGAFVYFSRLVSAVEAQAPAALPSLVERMAASPNLRVRELATKRQLVLAAMSHPLDLQFTALDGRTVDTAKWRGKVVLVDYWATWCVPCIEAMPHLKELYAKYHDRGLEVVNISVDNANARDALVKLVAKLELPWPQFFDGKAQQTEYAVRYGVQPIPHVLLAGPDGMIVAVNPTGPKLETEIRRLLRL